MQHCRRTGVLLEKNPLAHSPDIEYNYSAWWFDQKWFVKKSVSHVLFIYSFRPNRLGLDRIAKERYGRRHSNPRLMTIVMETMPKTHTLVSFSSSSPTCSKWRWFLSWWWHLSVRLWNLSQPPSFLPSIPKKTLSMMQSWLKNGNLEILSSPLNTT